MGWVIPSAIKSSKKEKNGSGVKRKREKKSQSTKENGLITDDPKHRFHTI
jgi:hypothetical protein